MENTNEIAIGCQFSLYPMTDQFIDVILDAIADLKNDTKLRVATDAVSTMLFGPSEHIFQSLETCFVRASKKTKHVVMNITFSHGCPGEPETRCCATNHPKKAEKKVLEMYKQTKEQAKLPVSAQFALYPLNTPKYMDYIYEEIEKAKQLVTVTPKHYCTRLDGNITDVLRTIQQSLENTIQKTQHVVVTAIISTGSPTE